MLNTKENFIEKLTKDLDKNWVEINLSPAGIFQNLPAPILREITNFLDTKSLARFMLSCKILFITLCKFHFFPLINTIKQKFQVLKITYPSYQNWYLNFDKRFNLYSIEGNSYMFNIQWHHKWAEQIEKEVFAVMACETTATFNSIAEGVELNVIIDLPVEFNPLKAEFLAKWLELPLHLPEEIKEDDSTENTQIALGI